MRHRRVLDPLAAQRSLAGVHSLLAMLLVGAVVVPACGEAEDTLLHSSVRAGDLKEVERLVQSGYALDKQGQGGQTPLMAASLMGQAAIASSLLEARADPSIGEQDGYTPFHGAGFQGRADVVKALYRAGLDPYDTHKDGFTGFHRACWGMERRHADTVRAFLKLGFDASHKAKDGKTCADMTRNEDTRRYLKNHAKKAGKGGNVAKPSDEM
mmetsp:Transcript_13390/g.29791  ORF Transcript_13390/g.29791 Transcript_13390/m.29791 type:complete len:212 (+) Transcript_13390:102-737(+)